MVNDFLKNSKILIVDDTPANIEVLTTLLSMEGYVNVEKTVDPRDVLDLYLRFEPDLILLDLNMPYMSGFEVMEQLQKMVNNQIYLPILVLTADVSDATKTKALSAGASDFLSKPFDLVEVSLRIRNLLYTNYLYSQIRDQNHLLEEKVKERTKEILAKNEELKIALERADAANRLKTAFLNNISHEIRTPLNGIFGFGQLIADPGFSFQEKSDFLYYINESSERLINTITSFLDISLLNSGNMEVLLQNVNPGLLINEVYEKYKLICEKKKIELIPHFVIDRNIPVINSDEMMLRKILTHLLDNAVKFTKAGSIELSMVINSDKNELLFSIKDTGTGISDSVYEEIFESFMQEEMGITRNFEGNGLGLPIVKGMLKLLGGKIWFESKKDKGSIFYFTIPFRKEELSVREETLVSPNEILPKLLIAEDDDINFHFIHVLLQKKSIQLIRAKNGREAVEIFTNTTGFKAVLMDLKLPVMDGFLATREIKLHNKNIPVIALTAYTENEERQKALYSGCDDYIIKPLKKQILFEVLKKYGFKL